MLSLSAVAYKKFVHKIKQKPKIPLNRAMTAVGANLFARFFLKCPNFLEVSQTRANKFAPTKINFCTNILSIAPKNPVQSPPRAGGIGDWHAEMVGILQILLTNTISVYNKLVDFITYFFKNMSLKNFALGTMVAGSIVACGGGSGAAVNQTNATNAQASAVVNAPSNTTPPRVTDIIPPATTSLLDPSRNPISITVTSPTVATATLQIAATNAPIVSYELAVSEKLSAISYSYTDANGQNITAPASPVNASGNLGFLVSLPANIPNGSTVTVTMVDLANNVGTLILSVVAAPTIPANMITTADAMGASSVGINLTQYMQAGWTVNVVQGSVTNPNNQPFPPTAAAQSGVVTITLPGGYGPANIFAGAVFSNTAGSSVPFTVTGNNLFN